MSAQRIPIKTTKKLAAFNQIHGAIENCRKGEWECAITLASAAEGVIPPTDRPHVLKELVEDSPFSDDLDYNMFNNWLKHPSLPDEIEISEFMAVVAIERAISRFVAAYGQLSRRMDKFQSWSRAVGYFTKTPIAEASKFN